MTEDAFAFYRILQGTKPKRNEPGARKGRRGHIIYHHITAVASKLFCQVGITSPQQQHNKKIV
jgi:hypothetical protein